MTSRADASDGAISLPVKGASARDRVLRFNRGIIGLCVAVLLAILFLPL
jgi:hypothetical protein